MAVALALARAGLRRRRGLVGLALVLALGIGAALTSLEAARRTQRAYPSYLRRSEAGQLVVNPVLNTGRVEEIIASTPGVTSYASHAMLLATLDQGEPRTPAKVEDASDSQLLVSSDGRYVGQDRPVVRQGRMIRGGAEAFVNIETARALDLKVGDTLPLAFWSPTIEDPPPELASRAVEPIGRSNAVIVGIGVFADEVLVDELYPRRRILVTPEVGSAFDCRQNLPGADDPRTLDQLEEIAFPPGCATSYRYFSLRLDGGDAEAKQVTEHLAARFADENKTLPAALREADISYQVIPSLTAESRRALDRSLQPAVRALQLFGVAAATTTLIIVLLGALQIARRNAQGARIWLSLGATRAQRSVGLVIPLAVAVVLGLAGSLIVGSVGAGIGPVASARSVERPGRLGLSGPIILVVLAVSAVLLAAGLGLVAARASTWWAEGTTKGPSPALFRIGSPSLAFGLRAARSSSGAKALLGASVAAVLAVVATVVFTTSLTGFVAHSERFGWPYDAGVMVGFGYDGADKAAISATLDRPEVEAWGMAAVASDSTIDGKTVPLLAGVRRFDALPLPVIEGKLPVEADEIALGALTADALGLSVGDKALLSTPYGERQATVRGLVVLPAVGPFLADRVGLGTGALLSERFLAALLHDAERAAGMEPGTLADQAGSFVVIDLREGVDPRQFFNGISRELGTWDVNGSQPLVYPAPVRPAPVADVAAMRAVPLALVAVFAVTMVLGLGVGIVAATRARRRQLAILRALGFLPRQLRATVLWHALGVVGVGVVVGLPLGIALGRTLYRAFATGLGLLPEPEVSPWWTVAIVLAAFGIALVTAARPALQAARTAPAAVLRHE